jgi:hypothetical protein
MGQAMRLRLILPLALLISMAFAGAARAATPGINVAGVPSATNVQQVINSGAKYARYFFLWSDAQPSRGALSPAYMAQYQLSLTALNAAGVKVDLVVTDAPSWANGSKDRAVPPSNPADMAAFMGQVAAQLKGKVAAYEVWNEPDNTEFWHGTVDAGRYTSLVQAVYPAVKAADPDAAVLAGPFSGNDYDFLAQMYTAGAKGSFDGVAVHTDTACLNNGPGIYYRDGTRIGRYSFLGYREVHNTMVASGDASPIWITELGWSSTATKCARGESSGKKPAGVGEAGQATALAEAYHCLSADPEVTVAEWFTLTDGGTSDTELNRYGLMRSDGSLKPAYAAFHNVALHGDQLTSSCGDFAGPSITVLAPTAGQQFADHLILSASASDPQGLHRISFLCDGKKISTFGVGLGNSHTATMTWYGSSKLAPGPHTIQIQSTDMFGNLAQTEVQVVKVDPTQLPAARTWVQATVSGHGLVRTVTGRVRSSLPFPIRGRVRFTFQVLSGTTWISRHRVSKNASHPFHVVQHLARAGRWRVQVAYSGTAPFKSSSAPSHSFMAH